MAAQVALVAAVTALVEVAALELPGKEHLAGVATPAQIMAAAVVAVLRLLGQMELLLPVVMEALAQHLLLLVHP
jgi:hypothetical protein